LTIISDQFEAIAYRWKMVQPKEMQPYFEAKWMNENILQNHGPLCASYKAHLAGEQGFEAGDFRSEGDSPAYMHTIVTGLRNLDNPDWGGWGGRYVKIRENTWLDKVPVEGYEYPARWWGENGWGRASLRPGSTVSLEKRSEYFKPLWMWTDVYQNDFVARADWCVKPFVEANHQPVVKLKNALDLELTKGAKVKLSAKGSSDPDGDKLNFKWWQYEDAGTYKGRVSIKNADCSKATFVVPENAKSGDTIHMICEVSDNGSPSLTRYQRVIVTVK
jgi:hypothetical protein